MGEDLVCSLKLTSDCRKSSILQYILFLDPISALRPRRKYLMSTKLTKTFIKSLLRPEINTHCKESSKENAFMPMIIIMGYSSTFKQPLLLLHLEP